MLPLDDFSIFVEEFDEVASKITDEIYDKADSYRIVEVDTEDDLSYNIVIYDATDAVILTIKGLDDYDAAETFLEEFFDLDEVDEDGDFDLDENDPERDVDEDFDVNINNKDNTRYGHTTKEA